MEKSLKSGHSTSYTAHINHISNIKEKEEFLLLKSKNSVHYGLVLQALKELIPFFDESHTWLTIGDLKGIDANFLKENQQQVMASDLSEELLIEAKKQGYINEHSKINAENIDLPDNSFDYVFCKEAFHHFPRAYLSLYEMSRVSKKATIIIEPMDMLLRSPLLMTLKNICDRVNPLLINKIWKNRVSFESVGNYVFKISPREIEKMAMGIGLQCIAFKEFNVVMLNDYQGLNQIPVPSGKWRKIMFTKSIKDIIMKLGLLPGNTLCSVIFKQKPDAGIRSALVKQGYTIIDLPKNPYVQ